MSSPLRRLCRPTRFAPVILACAASVLALLVVQSTVLAASHGRDHALRTTQQARVATNIAFLQRLGRKHVVSARAARALRVAQAGKTKQDVARSAEVTVAPALRRTFGVLRRYAVRASVDTPVTATPVALPDGVASAVATNGLVNVNVTDAQFEPVPNGGVWVVPGSDGMCILSGASYVTVCAPSANAEDGAVRTGDAGSDGKLDYVFGLVPDGNSTVTVTSADGSRQAVPVVGNVYEATGTDLVAVTDKTAAGAVVTHGL